MVKLPPGSGRNVAGQKLFRITRNTAHDHAAVPNPDRIIIHSLPLLVKGRGGKLREGYLNTQPALDKLVDGGASSPANGVFIKSLI